MELRLFFEDEYEINSLGKTWLQPAAYLQE